MVGKLFFLFFFLCVVLMLKQTNKCNKVLCFATWASNSVSIMPVIAELSLKYYPKIQFCKIDIGRYAGIAKMHNVSIKPTTKQLPTIILFENGKEKGRLPQIKSDGYIQKCRMGISDIEKHFQFKMYTQQQTNIKNANDT